MSQTKNALIDRMNEERIEFGQFEPFPLQTVKFDDFSMDDFLREVENREIETAYNLAYRRMYEELGIGML